MTEEGILYKATFTGDAIKELVKISKAINDTVNVKFGEHGIKFTAISPGLTAMITFEFSGDMIGYERTDKETLVAMPLRFVDKFANVIKKKDTVLFSFDGSEFTLQARGVKFKITSLTPETQRDVKFEPVSYVTIGAQDLYSIVKTIKGIKKNMIITIDETGLKVNSDEEEGIYTEFEKTALELIEHYADVEKRGVYIPDIIEKVLSTINKNYSITLGISEENVLVITFSTSENLGTATFYHAPMAEQE